jgi:hypothetical protein
MRKEQESFEPNITFDTGKEDPDVCVCPECGHETSKRQGLPCRRLKCPVCGTVLVGK